MEMPVGFIVKKLLEVFFLPPILPLVMIFYGISVARKTRHGKVAVWGGLFVALVFSMPTTVDWMAKPLESYPAIQPTQLHEAQAIVILGAGVRPWAREYGGAIPGRITLERLRYGARLARQTSLPVLVTGGGLPGQESEAKVMAASLQTDFGITPRWIEDRSLDTADNAVYSAAILKKAEINRVVLVTSAFHMRRAAAAFGRTGLEILPAPTVFFSDKPKNRTMLAYLPGIESVSEGSYIAHEWAGIFVQWIKRAL